MRVSQSLALIVASLATTAPSFAAPVSPHASWNTASLSNGHAAAVFDLGTRRLSALHPHPYREATKGAPTPDLLWDAFFGVARDNAGTWLPTSAPLTVAYENGTGILALTREQGPMRLTERWFAPMGLDAPAVIGHLTVQNVGAPGTPSLTGVRVAFLQNFHVGPGATEASSTSEQVTWDAGTRAFVERCQASGRSSVALPVPDADNRSASPAKPYSLWTKGDIGTGDPGPVQDDAISAFSWNLPDLKPGQEHSVAVALGVLGEGDPAALALSIRRYVTGSDSLLEAEREWWRAFHARDRLPAALAGNALALARQSLAMLAMSQVREPNSPGRTPHGQILASLPPGEWNRAWVRDQSYAVAALAATGHADVAADAVRFLLNGRANLYRAEVGADYAISVCRYYGDGGEESDGDPATDGPNIEFDGFGLFLWSLAEVAAGDGGAALVDEAWATASSKVADVLVGLVGSDGLVRPDSSIWERHWNGREKRFTYTDATAVLGLCAAAHLGRQRGDPRAATWAAAARTIAGATATRLVTSDVLASSLEEIPTGAYLDGAVLEAFNWEVLPPRGAVANATLNALLAGLAMATGRGLRRNDDGDWYDRQEWVFVDLRAATALRRAGRTAEAEALASWVLAQSRANLDLVAELYTEQGADYAGAVPMAGFGAASYLLWLTDPLPAADVASCLAPPVPDAVDAFPDEAVPPEPPPEPQDSERTTDPDLPGESQSSDEPALPFPDAADDPPTGDLDASTTAEDSPDVSPSEPSPDTSPASDLPDAPPPRASDGCTMGAPTPASPLPFLLFLVPLFRRRRRQLLAGSAPPLRPAGAPARRFLAARLVPGVSSPPGNRGGHP